MPGFPLLVRAAFFFRLFRLSGSRWPAEGFGWRAAILLAFLPWMLLRAGGIVTTLLRVPTFFALDFTVGVTVISVAVMAWKICMPLSVWLLLIVLVIAIVGIPEAIQHRQAERVCSLDFLAVIVALVAATGWCQDLIRPLGPSQDTFVVFKPWSDFFFHATILGRNLPNQTLLQVGNFEWKGLPAIFYHYASYSLPLLLAKAGNVPSYAAVVGFWAPFGSFLAGLSAYTLGRVFWGQGAGLAALAAAALFPDLYLLGEAHPFYGYYWLQHIEPAGLYGVSIAGTAVVFTVLGVREGRRSWILAGIVVGVMVAFFKVQIFTASFPVIFSLLLLGWPPRRRWQWLWLGLCVTVAVTGVQVANHFHIGPEVHFDLSGGSWYWKFLAGMARDTPSEAWYQAFHASDPFPQHLPQAIGLLLLNSLGLFALVAPLLWLIMLLRRKLDLSDGVSLAAILILLLMTFGLGRNSMLGLPEELIHRPFVWAYWLVASLTAGRLYSLVATRQSWARLSLAILCLLTLAPIYFGRGLQMGKWPAAASHYNVLVDRGLVESAHFIRNQESTDAVVQDSCLEEWAL